jgi:hypothetical protein
MHNGYNIKYLFILYKNQCIMIHGFFKPLGILSFYFGMA